MTGNACIETTSTAHASPQDGLTTGLEVATTTSFVEETRVSLAKQLRHQFPFLATAALEKLVEDATKTIRDGLEEARPAMVASKARSNFFTLPPELRNRILEDLLEDSPLFLAASECDIHGTCVTLSGEPLDVDTYSYLAARQGWGCKHVSECLEADCAWTRGPRKHERLVKPSSLLQVCRKLRAEVAPMFYGGKTFHFEISTLACGSWLTDWLRLVGAENASLIDKIHVLVGKPHIDYYLQDMNSKGRYKKEIKRGKRYKEVWGKKGLLGSLGLLGLGVPVERFEFSNREPWAQIQVTPWEQNIKPDYSPYYYSS